MKRNRTETGTITGIAEATAERVRLSGEILQALARAVAANQKAQRKFRTTVLIMLSRIEAIANMTYVAQMRAPYHNQPYFHDKLMEEAKHAEQFVSQQTDKTVPQIIKYIYDDAEKLLPKSKTRRKWSDCPSYDI